MLCLRRPGNCKDTGRVGPTCRRNQQQVDDRDADGPLSSLFALGSLTNSSVQAGSLSVVYVGGTISEDSSDGDTDIIHAETGGYLVIDWTKVSRMVPTALDTFGGVAASVG